MLCISKQLNLLIYIKENITGDNLVLFDKGSDRLYSSLIRFSQGSCHTFVQLELTSTFSCMHGIVRLLYVNSKFMIWKLIKIDCLQEIRQKIINGDFEDVGLLPKRSRL